MEDPTRDENKVVLVGNLTADPEFKTTANGHDMCRLRVATSREWKGKSLSDFHTVTAWGSLAEDCREVLLKGSRVKVVGRLSHRKYEDKEGVTKWVTDVVADSVTQQVQPANRMQSEDAPIPEDQQGNDLPF